MTTNTIAIRSHIKIDDIKNLLYSAAQGSGYWACDNKLGFESFVKKALTDEGVKIDDYEDSYRRTDGEVIPKTHNLNIKKIKRGLTVMAKKEPAHFADFVGDNADMITADVFLQCCLFGEVLYS